MKSSEGRSGQKARRIGESGLRVERPVDTDIAVDIDTSSVPTSWALRPWAHRSKERRDVEMREIVEEGEAIYYIGELPIHNMETYNFTVTVKVEGQPELFEVKFRQQLYTE